MRSCSYRSDPRASRFLPSLRDPPESLGPAGGVRAPAGLAGGLAPCAGPMVPRALGVVELLFERIRGRCFHTRAVGSVSCSYPALCCLPLFCLTLVLIFVFKGWCLMGGCCTEVYRTCPRRLATFTTQRCLPVMTKTQAMHNAQPPYLSINFLRRIVTLDLD